VSSSRHERQLFSQKALLGQVQECHIKENQSKKEEKMERTLRGEKTPPHSSYPFPLNAYSFITRP
jgi:hypothetical protein